MMMMMLTDHSCLTPLSGYDLLDDFDRASSCSGFEQVLDCHTCTYTLCIRVIRVSRVRLSQLLYVYTV